ncbi:MAG: dihydroorotase family protein [Promethearchaeota archaeon]
MDPDLKIKNARIYTPDGLYPGALIIKDGVIVRIGKNSTLPDGRETLDAKERLLIPGMIDVHVHLRDMNQSYKEDFYSGTCAAAAGGVTSVLDMPNNKIPITTPSGLRRKMKEARQKIITNVGFYSALPKSIGDLQTLIKTGAVAFKIYLPSPIGEIDVYDDGQLSSVFREISKLNTIVAFHPEERSSTSLKPDPYHSEIQEFLTSHKDELEKSAILRFIRINNEIGAKLHMCHMSSQGSLQAIHTTKSKNSRITCEVTPHHLFLTEKALSQWKGFAKMLPPLRTKSDAEYLWANVVNDGLIDIVASDHAPHAIEEKRDFTSAPSGIPGLETTLPLLLTQVLAGRLSMKRLVELTSENPARIFNLGKKGRIAEGYDADLTLIDTKSETCIDAEMFLSKAKFSPFSGWKIHAIPMTTIVGGRIVMRDREIVALPGSGNVISSETPQGDAV